MLIASLLGSALLVGLVIARWWAMALPAAIAVGLVLVSLLTGFSLGDSPVAFVTLVTTATVGFGVLLRRRLDRHNEAGQIKAG